MPVLTLFYRHFLEEMERARIFTFFIFQEVCVFSSEIQGEKNFLTISESETGKPCHASISNIRSIMTQLSLSCSHLVNRRYRAVMPIIHSPISLSSRLENMEKITALRRTLFSKQGKGERLIFQDHKRHVLWPSLLVTIQTITYGTKAANIQKRTEFSSDA